LHLVGILFSHINEDARSKSYQICLLLLPMILFWTGIRDMLGR